MIMFRHGHDQAETDKELTEKDHPFSDDPNR